MEAGKERAAPLLQAAAEKSKQVCRDEVTLVSGEPAQRIKGTVTVPCHGGASSPLLLAGEMHAQGLGSGGLGCKCMVEMLSLPELPGFITQASGPAVCAISAKHQV